MLSADKQNLLSRFLGKLPEDVSARLARAVEADRLTGGSDLPHEVILRGLKSHVRPMPPGARPPSPQRFFCQPFEDILVNPGRAAKQKGRIARSSVEPVWNWLEQDLMPGRLAEIAKALQVAALTDDLSGLDRKSAEMWKEIGAVLKPALTGARNMSSAAKRLGGMDVAEDAAEMALLLNGAAELAPLQKRLPKPITNLSAHAIGFVRDVFDRLTVSDPDLAPYVPLLVLGRLERLWEVLRLTAALSRKSDDTLISSTDIGVVGELLFDDLDVYVRKIEAARPLSFDSETLVADLARFSELSGGMVKELEIRREGKWGQHLARSRAAVGRVFEDLLERAPKEIFAALPGWKPATYGKARPLDLSRPPDTERLASAKRYAHLVAESRKFASAASFSAKLVEATDSIQGTLRTYAENILRDLRAAPPPTPPSMDAHFTAILQLCTLVLGPEETDLLRRRSRAAKT
jgi:hypothetical protein